MFVLDGRFEISLTLLGCGWTFQAKLEEQGDFSPLLFKL
jgi:hypothetical protein